MEETFVYVLSWLCLLTSIACQLVGIEICSRIIKKGAADVSPVPFFAFFVSSCWWLRYGIMQKISTVVMTNVFGAVLQFIYLCIYYIYSLRKSHVHRLVTLTLVLLFSPLIYIRYYQLDPKIASEQFGTLCSFATVTCYASPLATLATVLRTKSCDSMSFSLCLMNFLSAICWVIYGSIIDNAYVALPNCTGIILGVLQFGLFCIYPSGSSKTLSGTSHV